MTGIAQSVDSAVRNVCPRVEGVSIGMASDKTTWRVDFTPEATNEDREAVAVVLAGFDLAAPVKAELRAKVDADAERVRLRYITPGVGQSMTYLEKHNQAVAVELLGEQAANALAEQERTTQFPTLVASVGLEASTLWACAQLVIQRYEAWAALSNLIERARLAGKKAISDASDAAAAQAAYEAITWPTQP